MHRPIACPKCFSENLTITLASKNNTCVCICGWTGKDVERVPALFALGFKYSPKEYVCKFCKERGTLAQAEIGEYDDTMYRCLSCQRKWIEDGADS
jgi:phosphoenolpyruvate-protein kinase (PTS system EI component)